MWMVVPPVPTLVTNFVASLWTFSIAILSFLYIWDSTDDAYSK